MFTRRAAEPAEDAPVREPLRFDPLGALKDPRRRPRYILWMLVGLLVFVGVMVTVLGVTSTRWFCTEGCHKVQDDAIRAYQHSSHAEISCMSCHMPVNANPAVFLLHKMEALGELYLTVTNNFELPLNKDDEVALTMKSEQCTQCHDEQVREVTPSEGILIDHKVHAEKGVNCTICHNRIAHKEDFTPTGKDPKTGLTPETHPVFSSMTACFRCHTQGEMVGPKELKAPGQCSICHPAGFQLKPPSHLKPGFFPKGHGKLGKEAAARVESATAAGESEESGEQGEKESLGLELAKVSTINYCNTCHKPTFCSDCHGGVTMPHAANFKDKHAVIAKKSPQVCSRCHGKGNFACNNCHHAGSMGEKYNAAKPWIKQHPDAVGISGASPCFKCHKVTFCPRCHVNGGVMPQ